MTERSCGPPATASWGSLDLSGSLVEQGLIEEGAALSREEMPFLIIPLVLVPIAEIYLLLRVGQLIGFWPTLGITVLTALIGSHLARREGRRVWAELKQSVHDLRSPARGILEGALILVGGTLLLTPGLLTDAVGFLLLVPLTRNIVIRPFERTIDRYLRLLRIRRDGGQNSRTHGGVVETTAEALDDEPSQLKD